MKTDLTTCGDSGQYGLIFWFETKSERKAKKLAKELKQKINRKEKPKCKSK